MKYKDVINKNVRRKGIMKRKIVAILMVMSLASLTACGSTGSNVEKN